MNDSTKLLLIEGLVFLLCLFESWRMSRETGGGAAVQRGAYFTLANHAAILLVIVFQLFEGNPMALLLLHIGPVIYLVLTFDALSYRLGRSTGKKLALTWSVRLFRKRILPELQNAPFHNTIGV